MTTKTDRARECAEEIGKRFAGEWIAGPDIEELTKIIAKHFPPSVLVQSVYTAIDDEEELSDEPPKMMRDWLEHATPDEIIEAMRIAVRQTKGGIRNRVKALIAEAENAHPNHT